MIRLAARGAFALVLIAAVLETAGRGQPPAQDKIYYRDKKDNTIKWIDGELKPGPSGYQAGAGKSVVVVAPYDLVKVVPGELPLLDRKDLMAQTNLEDKKEWGKARDGYVEIQKLVKTAPEKTKRYLEFKIAYSAARAADDAKDDESWKPRAEEAVKLLDSFLVGHTSGWEVWPAARASAGLQAELGKYDTAAAMWARLAANKELTPAGQKEATVHEIDAKVRAKQFGAAKAKIEPLLASEPAGTLKTRLTIYQLAAAKGDSLPEQAVKPIEDEIAKSQDPAVRATWYSVLGELYMTGEKPNLREAMWSFLWVEVVYNQDKDEVLTALVRLADIFKQQGDDERAKAYHEKARRLRGSQ